MPYPGSENDPPSTVGILLLPAVVAVLIAAGLLHLAGVW